MHAVDSSCQSARWEGSTRFVAHQGRETAYGSTIGCKRDRESDLLRLEKVQHRVGMGFGQCEKVFSKNVSALEVFPFGGVRAPEVPDELITNGGESVSRRHPDE